MKSKNTYSRLPILLALSGLIILMFGVWIIVLAQKKNDAERMVKSLKSRQQALPSEQREQTGLLTQLQMPPKENRQESVIGSIGGTDIIEVLKSDGIAYYFTEPSTGYGIRKTFLGEFVHVGDFTGEDFTTITKGEKWLKVALKYLQPVGGAQLFISGAGNSLSLNKMAPSIGREVEIGYNGKLNNILGLSFASKDCESEQGQAIISGMMWKDGANSAETKRIYTFKQPIKVSCMHNDMYGEDVVEFFQDIDESSLSADLSSFDINLVNGQKLHIQLPKENAPTVTIK